MRFPVSDGEDGVLDVPPGILHDITGLVSLALEEDPDDGPGEELLAGFVLQNLWSLLQADFPGTGHGHGVVVNCGYE